MCMNHGRAAALRRQINSSSRGHHDPVRPPCPQLRPRRLSPASVPLNSRGAYAISASDKTSAIQGAASLCAGAGASRGAWPKPNSFIPRFSPTGLIISTLLQMVSVIILARGEPAEALPHFRGNAPPKSLAGKSGPTTE